MYNVPRLSMSVSQRFKEDAGFSSWKKGHFASLVRHTQVAEHPWIKAEFQEIFLEFYEFLYPL